MQRHRYIVQNIKMPIGASTDETFHFARKRLLKFFSADSISEMKIFKKSVDARKRADIKFVYSVIATVEGKSPDEEKLGRDGITAAKSADITPTFGDEELGARPVIVGFGPCGMFAALTLAKYGYRPIVLERGKNTAERSADVDAFFRSCMLDGESNIQFGAGGAGTFSDGKLMTRINDPKCAYVLETMVRHGAPEEILSNARPHIGTDYLKRVVSGIEAEIISLGGEIHYKTKFDGFDAAGGQLIRSVKTGYGDIECGVLMLAIGHSARDTFEMLGGTSLVITPKPFSVGVRIEHLQENIDKGLYGELAGDPRLPKGEYNLSCRIGGRGVYTFCMCPGGEVVAAASEHGGVVTNGMSSYIRSGKNANCAVAVSVLPDDFGGTVAGAINFQRRIESAAFDIGGRGYAAPCQSVGSFLGRAGCRNTIGDVEPTYMMGNVTFTDVGRVFPEFVTESLKAGIADFGKKLHGFDSDDALITAPETRTSSPIRICREKNYTAQNYKNLYVGGEGAGYAGGITSAAVDGINMALSLMAKYKPPKY